MVKIVSGQRWVSNSEPELGLGIILQAQGGRVEILFPAAGERRIYAMESAPLRRVQYAPGDTIRTHEGQSFTVTEVTDTDGLLLYHAGSRQIQEGELADATSFSKPEDRLLAGQVDETALFAIRSQALTWRHRLRQSPSRGFQGGRIDLIPHQLAIADEVSSRLTPRVLLADEVGLGKTIEACLIMHRLRLTGRADRVLILLPESLIHQWFVELLRRFNLSFSIFDEERCLSIEAREPDANPFLDSQLVLCDIALPAHSPERARQLCEAGWDILIVDEAHHLEWHPDEPSPEYSLVEFLASQTHGLLLLTATPAQLGPEGHFARLRLLDPDHYTSLPAFLEEAKQYELVAKAIERLVNGKKPTAADSKLIREKSAVIREHYDQYAAGDASQRPILLKQLLDAFGPGRVMFRNSRTQLKGFPKRKAHLCPLPAQAGADEVRLAWLIELLADKHIGKVLLICDTAAQAESLAETLQRDAAITAARFHEGMTLIQRDRAAAYFADEEDGARILLCSGAGSEGRNFQFAHHLVLYDLPRDPDLLEQRIGRLDRIGQTHTINIHVPYLTGTASEVLARWYHEGLNALEQSLHGGSEILQQLAPRLQSLLDTPDSDQLASFIKDSKALRQKVALKLKQGQERLLELSSAQSQDETLIPHIRETDNDSAYEEFLINLLDHLGVTIEDAAPRTWILKPGNLRHDALPDLPPEGMTITFDRTRALAREDIQFFGPDHPLARTALDALLSSENGNSGFALWPESGSPGILLEACLILECMAPPALHADRFLPITPIRVTVDHSLTDVSGTLDQAPLVPGSPDGLLSKKSVRRDLIPAMLEKTRAIATRKRIDIINAAARQATRQLQEEIERLQALAEINDHIRPDEITKLTQQQSDLKEAILAADLRLDSLRLIMKS